MREANTFRVNGVDYYTGGPTSWQELISYVDEVITGKNIPKNTGVPTNASAYFWMFVFRNPKFTQVKFHTSIWGNDLAEIAFYSGDEMTAENYDSVNSVSNTSGDNNHHISIADVPDTAKIMVLTSRVILNDNTTFDPEAWADTNEQYTRFRNKILTEWDICYGYRDAQTDEPTGERYIRRAETTKIELNSPEVRITANFSRGYQLSVTTFTTDGYYSSSWYSSEYHYKLNCKAFKVTVKRIVDGSEVDLNLTGLEDIGLQILVVEGLEIDRQGDGLMKSIILPANNLLVKKLNKRRYYGNIFDGYKFLCHMLVNKIESDNILVPCQSLANIELAHRLGYKMFELNVHKTATTGVYVCMHGVGGKIGKELVNPNGTDITNVMIAEVPESTFRNTYVYNTTSDKYRTHITFLDDALKLLKKYNMIPYVQFPSGEYDIVEYIRDYVGDNFVLYYGNTYYLNRVNYEGIINYYGNLDADGLRDICRSVGAPFIYSLTAEQCNSYTDVEMKEMIDTAHEEGCLIAAPGAYIGGAKEAHLLELGVDGSGTAYAVEDFDNGNVCSKHDNETFSDFTHNGSVSGGKLTLSNNQTIESGITGTAPFLSKGSLKIRYSGTLLFTMGERFYQTSIESDGSREVWLSTWFMNELPNFTVKASGAVTVYSCVYNASVC